VVGTSLHKQPMLKVRRAAGYAAIFVAALLFAIGLSFAYGTVKNLHGNNVFSSLADRLTTEAASPARTLITSTELYPFRPHSVFANDFSYTIRKYSGVGYENRYPTSQIVAATQFGTQDDIAVRKLVPVTTGAFAELTFDLGWWSVVVAALIGALFAQLETAAVRASHPLGFMAAAVGLLALIDWVTKGNGVYVLFNWGFVLLACLVTLSAAHYVAAQLSGKRHECG